ncbi:penicillin-binding 1A domain protein (plasmid) [Clostridium botulinum]|uniref:Penicillin-binding 1A domain protein n=1 Tax=Clostridium botulinum TaxID=1491 RepID=A0A1L7JN48_CLOBO|nr:penicillin-binding 1A domain protein [Clostridium botulinum]
MNIKRHKTKIMFIRIFSILLGLIFLSGGIFYFKYKDSLFLSMKNAKEKIAKIDNTTFIRTGATNIYDKDNNIINSINPFHINILNYLIYLIMYKMHLYQLKIRTIITIMDIA